MKSGYRWLLASGAIALAVASGAWLSRGQVAWAEPSPPTAWGPGMVQPTALNTPATQGGFGGSMMGGGFAGGATLGGGMMGGWSGANVPALTPELANQMGRLHAQMHGGDPQQAAQWMLQIHNATFGGGGPEQIPQSTARPGAKRVEASLSLKESSIQPAVLKVDAGSRLALTIKNGDDEPHDFLLPALGLRLVNIGPGTSRTVELNADTPGSYPFFCDLPGHAQRGQRGTLVIGGKQ